MGGKVSQSQLWIGMVELKPVKRPESGPAGAFTNIVTWAVDKDSFRAKAEVIAAKLDRYVVEIENPEPLTSRFRNGGMDEEIEDMVRRAEANPNAIVYGTFHNYRRDEA